MLYQKLNNIGIVKKLQYLESAIRQKNIEKVNLYIAPDRSNLLHNIENCLLDRNNNTLFTMYGINYPRLQSRMIGNDIMKVKINRLQINNHPSINLNPTFSHWFLFKKYNEQWFIIDTNLFWKIRLYTYTPIMILVCILLSCCLMFI